MSTTRRAGSMTTPVLASAISWLAPMRHRYLVLADGAVVASSSTYDGAHAWLRWSTLCAREFIAHCVDWAVVDREDPALARAA